MLKYTILLLLAAMVAGGITILNQRARQRKVREFAKATARTLQLETCGGIGPGSLYDYLLALASAFRMQAMLRNLKLQSGEFEQVVTNAVESAYLLRRDESNRDAARGALLLFASSLDAIMSKTLPGELTASDEGNFVGTAGAVAMLSSAGWHAGSNADLVTCALTETYMAKGAAEYWRSGTQAHRDQVEQSFERVVRMALDPSTAGYVRQKVFSDLQEVGSRTSMAANQ